MQRREFLRNTALTIGSLPLLSKINFAATGTKTVNLVSNGKAATIIAVPTNSDDDEKLAAADLVEYIEKISGVKLETATVDAGGVEAFIQKMKGQSTIPLFLGSNVLPLLQKEMGDHAKTRGAFALKVDKDSIMIAGAGEGTYYGVMELLEQWGVRWVMPGDLGTVIPSLKTLAVAEQTTVQAPSFPSRWFQMPNKDWQQRVRCGGDYYQGAHGIPAPPYKLNNKTGEYEPAENAKYYALINGQRKGHQLDVSKPWVIEYAANAVVEMRKAGRGPVIGMGPADGGGFCECDECKALDAGDYDPFSGEVSVTDRYIWFFNQVLAKVLPQYPDTKLAFYIYHTYMRPPLREKPHPHIQGALATIGLDRIHGFSNPVAPEKSYAKTLFEQWGKLIPDLYDRSYWSNLSDPGNVFILINRLRDEIPQEHALGVKGFRQETFANYATAFPSMYIAAKLMWNHKADVDALLQDVCEKYFGPAQKPMHEYITMMDTALRDGDYCTGSAWDIPHFYPPQLRAQAKVLLAQATRRVEGKNDYADRVTLISQAFELTDHFCGMMEARAALDFQKANDDLIKMDAVANKLMAYKPVPMLLDGRHSTYLNYMRRFFRPATEQAYARISGGNELIAAAPDEWEFQIDPLHTGEDIGLWRNDITGGNWQKIKTSSSSWSNQGLRYYKGIAWYRTVLNIPEKFAGKRIFLWCGGVDETAKVWINGKVIGISPGASFYPFEMDATPAARPGDNVITFCVSNEVVNELGTGGIVAPVILYMPAKGKNAVLENMRELKPTFP